MSTYVVAVRDLDGQFKKMMEIKKYCDGMKVSYPKEVQDYFGTLINESDRSITEEMSTIRLEKGIVHEFSDRERAEDGISIELAKLPKEVKILKFINSY